MPTWRYDDESWRYDKEFVVDTSQVHAKVRVAYQSLQPYDDDDPLHGLFAWLRLVVWTDEAGEQRRYLNASSELRRLLRAPLLVMTNVSTGQGFSLFLIDYESPRFEMKMGRTWDGEIVPPNTFLEYLGREGWRRERRERTGP